MLTQPVEWEKLSIAPQSMLQSEALVLAYSSVTLPLGQNEHSAWFGSDA